MGNRHLSEQISRNAASATCWDTFAGHRAHVTGFLVDAASETSDGRLCLLGAGNCNDIDLAAVLDAYRFIRLIDVDADALRQGLERQNAANNPAIQAVDGCDLTGGLVELLAQYDPATAPISDAAIDDIIEHSATAEIGLTGDYDTVASTCLISQLIEMVVKSVGETHPRFVDVLTAVRLRHARLLAELLKPGGVGLLLTDFVSSDSAPELLSTPAEEVEATVTRLISAGNFFHGLHPFVLTSLFQSDPQLSGLVGNVELKRPWLWHLGSRVYATTAIRFRRR